MARGSRTEADEVNAAAPGATQGATPGATHSAPAVADAGAAEHRARMLLDAGVMDPDAIAALHASMGNASVLSILGFDDPYDFDKPRLPKTTVPMTTEDGLKAITDKGDAERLLTAKGLDASKQAAQALDILLLIPDSHRGKVIDELDCKAFENLCNRISEAERERFMRLVEVAHNPERKLALWAAAHKSRATNDIVREQGDMGPPIPTYTDDDGEVWEDEEVEEEIVGKLSKEQLRRRKRHRRRLEAVESTHTEVDTEVKALMAKSKKQQLTLADVDAMVERKELEYKVEQAHNVNLTTQSHPRVYDFAKGENVAWETDELKEVDLTLGRLDHAKDPDSFKELRRTESHGVWDGVGGQYHGDHIEVRDGGATTTPGYRHGGHDREGVSDAFKTEHGEKIGTLEFVLTHEIGHDYAARHEKTYEAFQKAAGWEKVKVDALVADGVSEEDIDTLDARRANPSGKTYDISGKTRIYNPVAGSKDEYWAVPLTAIPAQYEAGDDTTLDATWDYARVSPDEHFAETYAKAVHVPEQLYEDLIVKPARAVEKARDAYEPLTRQIAKLEADPSRSNMLKLANLRAIAAALKADLTKAETAQKQQAAQFELMRNDVFGTDKAVKQSLERLKAKKLGLDKIEEFTERAAKLSTPEQIAFLEAEVAK